MMHSYKRILRNLKNNNGKILETLLNEKSKTQKRVQAGFDIQ